VKQKKIKKSWVKALMSGEYNQTTETLYNPDEDAYCCLGVLCEVAPMVERVEDGLGVRYIIPDVAHSAEVDIPPEAWPLFNLDRIVKIPKKYRETWFDSNRDVQPTLHAVLVHMNDHGATFKRIARFVEKWA
jgi:hypothetical protein